jgi:predicted enzyme related to lactoylglutathione lyase
MANPVVHFEVTGKDMDALNSFYSQLFGWKTNKVEGEMPYTIVEAGGDGGIGGGIGATPEGDGHVTFYVQVDDLQAALDKAGELGGSTVMPPMDMGENGAIALFNDPEGHMVGLFKVPQQQSS